MRNGDSNSIHGDNDLRTSGSITTGDQSWSFESSKRTAGRFIVFDQGRSWVCDLDGRYAEERARLIAAAPALLASAQLLEAAETAHANCPECEGEEIPELCPVCFPLFDDARIARRAAIAKAQNEKAA